MKRFNVYAIGNAIVDYEIKVDDQFLIDHEVEKGYMTLVEEARQSELLAASKTMIRKKQGGGSAANTMVALSQLGGNGFYSCRVANDEDGIFYLKDLHQNGLETNLDPNNLPDGTTGKCLVMISPDAERTMNTYLGITTNFDKSDIVKESLINAEYLYIEGALIAGPTGREAIHEAKKIAQENGVKVSFTLWDPSMVKYFGAEMKALIGDGVDLLFCNEEEAKLYVETENVTEAAEELKKIAKQFVITKSKKGSLLWDGKEFIEIQPVQIEALDSTGAGDMFAGAFMYGITNGMNFKEAGNLASKASAQVVAQFGPRLKKIQLKEIKSNL